MKRVLIGLLAAALAVPASADTGFFARLGNSYPPIYGAGPFDTITHCVLMLPRLYGSDSYKWHCEIRVY